MASTVASATSLADLIHSFTKDLLIVWIFENEKS